MRYIVLFLTALMLVTLSSCIDGEEEVFINADGSARVRVVYRVPGMIFSGEDAELLRKNIAKEMGKRPHLKLVRNQVEKDGGNRVITVEIETDDMTQMEGALGEQTPGEGATKGDKMLQAIIGNITVSLQGLSADFTREVDLTPLLSGGSASYLGDSEFRYIVHLPKAAKTSNAHAVEDDGRTLKWAFKLSECEEKPIVLKVVAPIPLPWWVYGVVVGFVVIFLCGVWWLVARWKVRKKNQNTGENKGETLTLPAT